MTRNAMYKKGRRWMATIWEKEDIDYLKKLKYNYLIISDDDHTEDGQLHWHALIDFPNPRARPATLNAHWEIPNDVKKAIDYCKEKGENYFVDGFINLATNKKDEWKSFTDLCKTATPMELIESEYSKLYARFPTYAGTVHNTFACLDIIDGELEHEWCYGNPGTGKTKYAFNLAPISEIYIKAINKWWDGYHGQDIVIIDDVDPSHAQWLVGYLKIWGDRYPFRAECKGTSMEIRPKKIVITSNYHIDDFCQTEIDANALKRRFKIKHFKKLGDFT